MNYWCRKCIFLKIILRNFCLIGFYMPHKKFEPRHDKTNKMAVCPVKTQISLGICPVWPKSWLCTQWVGKDPSFLHADSEDSDQTGRMPRLIWVFAGCTLLVLSRHGSFLLHSSYNWPHQSKIWQNKVYFLLDLFSILGISLGPSELGKLAHINWKSDKVETC